MALAGSLFFTVPVDAARPNVALYLLVTMTPFALVAPVLGPALDRAKKRRVTLAVGACLGRAVLCVLMARHLQSLLLYPEAFGVLVLMRGFQVAKSSLVPAVVTGKEDLVRANSRLTLAGVFGGAVAAAVAVGLLQIGAPWVLWAGAITYVVAAAMAAQVPATTSVEDLAAAAAPSPRRRLGRRGIHLHGIGLASLAMAVLRAGVGFLVFLLAFALKREGEPAWFYGLVIGISSVGGLLGAVAAPRLRALMREEAVLFVALAIPAGVAMLGARAEARPAAMLVAFAVGLGAASGRAGFDSLVQRDAPDTVWGRSFARYEAYFQLAWVVGAFIPVLISLSPGRGLLVLAMMLVAGNFAYLAGLAADSLVHARHPHDG